MRQGSQPLEPDASSAPLTADEGPPSGGSWWWPQPATPPALWARLPRLRRIGAVFVARNQEFLRDRASLAWNLAFPLIVLFGFAFVLGGGRGRVLEVALLATGPAASAAEAPPALDPRYVEIVPVSDREDALRRLRQHRFDLVLAPTEGRYWINTSSPRGFLAERVLLGGQPRADLARGTVEGREIRYVDWLAPGLLGMNVMFSSLFGVGYVIVRYRKNGVLRRLRATPLRPFEFLAAQLLSRLVLVLLANAAVWIGADAILHFQRVGSYATLALVFFLGAVCMTALGLVLAARTSSEELAGGLLNLVTLPMIGLSGVWFSIESAPRWVRAIANALPLTHLNESARAVMTDGAGPLELWPRLAALAAMAILFLAVGAALFRWE